MAERCAGTTATGRACRAWAVPGTNPPLCAAHRDSDRRPGAPEGNQNAVKHGLYAQAGPDATEEPTGIDAQIADLDARIEHLGNYIDEVEAEIGVDDYIRLLDLHSKMMGRVTRMRQARGRMGEDEHSELFAAINAALDEIAEEQGVEL